MDQPTDLVGFKRPARVPGHRYTLRVHRRERGHAPGGLKDRRRRTEVPLASARHESRARDFHGDFHSERTGGKGGISEVALSKRQRRQTDSRLILITERTGRRESAARHATPLRKGALRVSLRPHGTHTHHTHATRNIRARSARYLLSHSFGPAILPFEFSLWPRRREERCVSCSSLATLSPLPATTSVSRAPFSRPTSTRDLFTNPSTIPADWLAARRARRNTARCQQAASSRTSGGGCHSRKRVSRRRTGELRVNVAGTHVVDRHHGPLSLRVSCVLARVRDTNHRARRTASTFHHGVYPRPRSPIYEVPRPHYRARTGAMTRASAVPPSLGRAASPYAGRQGRGGGGELLAHETLGTLPANASLVFPSFMFVDRYLRGHPFTFVRS